MFTPEAAEPAEVAQAKPFRHAQKKNPLVKFQTVEINNDVKKNNRVTVDDCCRGRLHVVTKKDVGGLQQ